MSERWEHRKEGMSEKQLAWAVWKDQRQRTHRCTCNTCWRAYLRETLGPAALDIADDVRAAISPAAASRTATGEDAGDD